MANELGGMQANAAAVAASTFCFFAVAGFKHGTLHAGALVLAAIVH
jgi:hypothetical protein